MDVAMVPEAPAESLLPARDVQAHCGAKKQQVPEECLPEGRLLGGGEGACEEHSRISDPRLKEGEKTTRPPQRRRDPLAPATEEGTHRDQSLVHKVVFLKVANDIAITHNISICSHHYVF